MTRTGRPPHAERADDKPPVPVVIEDSASSAAPSASGQAAQRKVLAWGLETATGFVRHIRDVPRARTGRKCGIECVGCGLPLEAFNGGATVWRHRPHFKHPKGTQREDCEIVASRLAVVDALTQGDALTLPARHRSSAWVGLSGMRYEVWRNVQAERAQIRTISYSDRTRALITLDDGRQLAVMLRGDFSLQDADPSNLACLTIEAGTYASLLSELSPEELRERLTLLPDVLAWQCHWRDSDLTAEATLEAKSQARDALDEWPSGWGHDAGDRRRETLLHRLVREILASAQVIDVPGWRHAPLAGELRSWPSVPSHRLTLSNLRSERGLAGRIPDIQCAATAEDKVCDLTSLVIEVVVHNDVTDEKLAELRAAGAAVLEISLKHWGGRITMEELRSIVVPGLDCKRWLHHPLRETQVASIAAERALAEARRVWHLNEPQRNLRSAERPPAEQDDYGAQEALLRFGAMYRDTAAAYLEASELSPGATLRQIEAATPRREAIWAQLCWISDELEDLGAPGATDHDVLFKLMARMLSICEDRGIGHASSQNARAVINHVWTEVKNRESKEVSVAADPSPTAVLCTMAFQAFEIDKRQKKSSAPYEQLCAVVRSSLLNLERRFLWDRMSIPLVRAVFPELANAIDKLVPRMTAIAERQQSRPIRGRGPARLAEPSTSEAPPLKRPKGFHEMSPDELIDMQQKLRRLR
jgi:hypothetical protein